MTDNKKSEPAKGSGRPGSAAPGQGAGQAKRPTPTIELQATEIERRDLPASGAAAAGAPTGAGPQTSSGPQAGTVPQTGTAPKPEPGQPSQTKGGASGQPGDQKPGEAKSGEVKSGGTGPAAAGASAQSEADKPATPAASKAGAKSDTKVDDGRPDAAPPAGTGKRAESSRPAAAPPRTSRAGSLLSHLAAGVLGGGLTLFGADYAANTFGIEVPTASAPKLERLAGRIGALEQESQEQRQDLGASALRERIDRLEGQLGGLAGTGQSLDQATAAQKALAERLAALEAQTAQQGQAGGQVAALDERLAKLEATLKTLASAGDQGQGGRLPQIAALLARVEQVEQQLDNGLLAIRKTLTEDLQKQSARVEERLAESSKDMTLETLKASGKQLSEEIVGLKTEAERLGQEIATVGGGNAQIRTELAALQQLAQGLRAELQGQIGTLVKTDQLTAVTASLAKLEGAVAALVGSEQSRAQGASRILLSLELANLKRAIERGAPFAAELAQIKRLTPEGIDLTALGAHAETGLPTAAALASEFQPIADAALDAEQATGADATLLDSLLSGARSVVRVRKTGEVPGDSTEAILARTEARLGAGDLEGALREATALKGAAKGAAEPWLARLAARLEIDRSLAAIETSLKSLMSQAGTN